MGAVSTIPAFLDALRAALVLRAGLAGVNVFTGPVGDLEAGAEAIVVGVEAFSAEAEYLTAPQVECWEQFDVTGWTWTQYPGAGESVIKQARDRAFEILEQLHDYLAGVNTTTAATVSALGVNDARLVAWELSQFFGDGTRDCKLKYTIRVKARFTPAG